MEACCLSQTKEGQTEQIYPQTFDDFFLFFDSLGIIYGNWVATGQTVNKEYNVEVLRKFRKRFQRKRLALLKSCQWHFQQNNAPVHISILVTDYLTKIGIKTVRHPPYSTDFAPCDFWLFPKLRIEFHVCTINKSGHTKKFVNLFNDPRIYIYIYTNSAREVGNA